MHTIKRNTGALVVASKETGLNVNADKPKYMVISRDQNAERSHDTKIHNCSFEWAEEINCLGKSLTNNNNIFNCKWAVARWQWSLCMYINMK